jgi:hypothetical protein
VSPWLWLAAGLVALVWLAIVTVAAAEDDPDGLQDGDATPPAEALPDPREAA